MNSYLLLDFGQNPQVLSLLDGCNDLSLLDFEYTDNINASNTATATTTATNNENINTNSDIIVKLNGMYFSGRIMEMEGSNMITNSSGKIVGLGKRRIRLLQFIAPNSFNK